MDMVKAEGLLASLAEEMDMMVVVLTFAFAFTKFIRECAATVLESVDNIMLMKQGKHTEDARLVHR